ncbi:MAG: hypothetical protein J7L12_03755 [Desulfurococcales archaeon]|nr:hypothetical protein [Desulfurococcales archaeon]
MKVRVRYVGALFDYLGVFEDILELDDGVEYSVADILEAVRAIRPKFRIIESYSLWSGCSLTAGRSCHLVGSRLRTGT